MGIECQSVESLMNVISAGNGMGTPYQQAYKYQASCNPWDPLLLGRLYLYHNPLGMNSSNLQLCLGYRNQQTFVRSSPHSIFLDTSILSPSHTQQGKIFLAYTYQPSCNHWDPFFQGKASCLFHNSLGNEPCNLHFSLAYRYQEMFAFQFRNPTFQDKPVPFPSRILLVQIGPVRQQPWQELRCKLSC